MTSHNYDAFDFNHLLEIIATERNSKPPIDVETIAKSMGLEINYEQMICDGLIEENSPNKYLIRVNERSGKLRQRFTIAHEMAHLMVKTGNRFAIVRLLERNFPRKKGLSFDWSNDEKLCDLIAASILIPPGIAKQFSDWNTFSIKKISLASRQWQVSISTFLWSVFAVAQYEGGFIWYKIKSPPNDLTDIQLSYYWSKFPKSCGVDIPETVFLRTANGNLNYSIVDFTRNEERFHPRVKFEFKGLSEYHAVRIKAFGKGKEKKILVVVYPKEIKPQTILNRNCVQKTII
jgi:Zn-dependent peptidase ImmA (M78 family)